MPRGDVDEETENGEIAVGDVRERVALQWKQRNRCDSKCYLWASSRASQHQFTPSILILSTPRAAANFSLYDLCTVANEHQL